MKRLLLLLLLTGPAVYAQDATEHKLVQFSGVVVTSDSLMPLPFVSVLIKDAGRGTVSDYYGFFSFVAREKDTIEFAAIGYKRAYFIIPDTLEDSRCSMIQILKRDTILLKEVVIFPWPTKEQFKEAFIHLRIPDDDLARAERNLNPRELSYLATKMTMDGSMNFKNYMDQHTTQLYYAGQLPPMSILDPIKWSKFIEMWQSGAFKKKDDYYDNKE